MGLGNVNLFLSLLVLVAVHTVYSYYVALPPKSIRPDSIYRVPIRVSNSRDGRSVTVEGKIVDTKDNVQESGLVTISDGQAAILEIRVGSLTPGNYKLKLQASDGLNFNNETSIKLEGPARLTFIQTDKGVYKAGDIVRIRAFATDKDLIPMNIGKTIRVKNPSGSTLQKYIDDGSRVVFEDDSFTIFSAPQLGDWKIEVEYEDGFKDERSFKVDEYVPPKFEVDAVVDPKYLVVGEKGYDVVVTVTATYTYGKGVKGDVLLMAGKRVLRKDKIVNKQDITVNLKKEIDSMGEYDDERAVEIAVNVTDETDSTISATVTVILVKSPGKVKFDKERSDQVYRNGTSTKVVLRVTDPVGDLLPEKYGGSLTVTLTDYRNDREETFSLGDGRNGFYTWNLTDIPSTANSLSLNAKLRIDGYSTEKTDYLSLQKYQTVGLATLNARWISKSDEMGGTSEFAVDLYKSEDWDLTSLWYMVISRGNIVRLDPVLDWESNIVVNIEPELCPVADIVVFGLTKAPAPELIADRLKLELKGCHNKEVKTSTQKKLETGEMAPVNVQVSWTDRSRQDSVGEHKVYLLAVDKSMVLLQDQNNDITQDRVEEELGKLKMGSDDEEESGPFGRRKRSIMPRPYPGTGATSTGALLKNVGLNVLADVDMKDVYQFVYDGPIMMMEAAGAAPENDMMEKESADVDDSERAPTQEVSSTTVVRKDFPDTWIWESASTNNNGLFSMEKKLPDSITSWVISAFAVRDDEEMAVTIDPAELAVYNPFFVTLNLPYSIRRTEIFILRCTVFNYEEFDRKTEVTLQETEDFDIIGKNTQNVMVKRNDAESVEFQVLATNVKTITLTVKAIGSRTRGAPAEYTDIVIKTLIVEPEGEKHTMARTLPLIVGLNDKYGFKQETVKLNFPVDTVPQSKKIFVKITGNMMGNALSNIDDLVTKPYGCGEQNMISVVPNIAAMTYLRAVGGETAEFTEKAIKYMTSGYNREQTYRYLSGGYSAFGESEKNESAWLTAFVLRSFAQAKEFIPSTVDVDQLKETVEFLWSLEKSPGIFRMKGRVIHQDMLGGTGSGNAFSVYITMCFLEASMKGIPVDQPKLNAAVETVRQMASNLVDETPREKKQFEAAIMAYTLALANDAELVTRLLRYVNVSGAPWNKKEENPDQPEPVPYYNRPPGPSAIEITSYCIQAYLKINRYSDAHPLVIWLQEQQNEKGGFSSTQNTMVALLAIGEFAAQSEDSANSVVNIILDDESNIEKRVDTSNRRLLQILELPSDVTEVTVKATGRDSLTLVKVVWTYHIKPEEKGGRLTVTSKGTVVRPKLMKYTNCMKLTDENASDGKGMYVMTIQPPSGMVVDNIVETKKENPHAKRLEIEKDLVHIYSDEPSEETCFVIKMSQEYEVLDTQPGTTWAYSYYNSDEIYNSVEVTPLDNDGDCKSCPTDHAAPLASLSRLLLTAGICLLISLVLAV